MGKIYRFVGSTITIGGAGVPFILISGSGTALTYDDGGVHTSKNDFYGVLGSNITGTTGAGFFELSKALPFQLAMAKSAMLLRWGNYVAASATYAGTFIDDGTTPLAFRRVKFGKTVRVKGVTNNSVPGSLVGNTVIFTLPAVDAVDGMTYRPVSEHLFVVYCVGSGPVAVRVKTNGDVCIAGDLIASPNVGVSVEISFDVD